MHGNTHHCSMFSKFSPGVKYSIVKSLIIVIIIFFLYKKIIIFGIFKTKICSRYTPNCTIFF